MSHHGALEATPSQWFIRWLRSDTFTQVYLRNTGNGAGFITLVAAFARQCVIEIIKIQVKKEPQMNNENYLLPDRFQIVATSATSKGDPEIRRSWRKNRSRRDKKPMVVLKSYLKNADKAASHSHSLMQIMVWRP